MKTKANQTKKHTSFPSTESDNYPPHSRIFITCGKYFTQEELYETFSKFGSIEYCRLLTEKISGLSKGSAFLKFRKTSSAAKAIEEMNFKTIGNHTTPLTVEIAIPKGNKKLIYTNEPEDTPPRSRLFVVCPKEMKESTLHERFRGLEGLEYAKVISDKETGESKGFAFIKFKSAYFAALAMEDVSDHGEIDGVKVKVLIADPKMKSQSPSDSSVTPARDNYAYQIYPEDMGVPYPMVPYNGYYGYPMYGSPTEYFPSFPPMPRVVVNCDASITTEQLYELFSGYYGVEHCEMEEVLSKESRGIGHVTFNSLQAADHAMLNIHGTEFPQGSRIECAWEPVQAPTIYHHPSNIFLQPYPQMYALSGSPPMSYPPIGNQTKVMYSSTQPIDEATLSKLFANYGHFVFTHQEKENSKGIVTFSDPNAAWCVVRDLDQYQTNERNVLSLNLL